MPFCLPKFTADILKGKFKTGEITPEKLSEMLSSADRRNALSFLGEENAKQVNALFESKLLLKNQQTGMINWAKQILKMKPEQLRDTLSKVQKMTEVLSEQDLQKFKEDLVNKKLGFGVTQEQAGKLVDMAKNVEDFKKPVVEMQSNQGYRERYDSGKQTPQEYAVEMKYGTSLALFKRYVENLKPGAKTMSFKEFISSPSKYFENLSNTVKSIVASADNSLWGNQGIGTLLDLRTSHIWVKDFLKSWVDIAKSLKGDDPMLAIEAHAYSRPDAIDGTFLREKLDIGLQGEEAHPTTLPEKIPGIGRLFAAADNAFNGGAIRLRVELAERMNRIARKSGVDLTDASQAEPLGRSINSGTGRGYLGTLGPAAPKINAYVFSIKLVKGTFDTLTAGLFDKSIRSNPFARKQAAYKIMNMAATYYAFTGIYEALNPGSTEQDPRAPHFGQIKVGNSWINITGPYRPLVRTMGTLIPTIHNGRVGFWRKNAKGVWQGVELYPTKTPGYGAFTPLDLLEGFVEGKASPLFGAVLNHWRGADYLGKPVTPTSEVTNLITPITIKNYFQDVSNPNIDNLLITTIPNFIGANVTTY